MARKSIASREAKMLVSRPVCSVTENASAHKSKYDGRRETKELHTPHDLVNNVISGLGARLSAILIGDGWWELPPRKLDIPSSPADWL